MPNFSRSFPSPAMLGTLCDFHWANTTSGDSASRSRLRRHLLDQVVGMLLAEGPDRVADHERVAYGAY